jgi:hypothetical protein
MDMTRFLPWAIEVNLGLGDSTPRRPFGNPDTPEMEIKSMRRSQKWVDNLTMTWGFLWLRRHGQTGPTA